MTPEQAQLLAEHAASVWADVLPAVWATSLQRHDFAETRNALSRLRMRDVRSVTLVDLAAEIEAARGPCSHCNGERFLTELVPAPIRFDHDREDQPATPITAPDLDPAADHVETARAWIATIRNRPTDRTVTHPRLVAVTSRCPRCNQKVTTP